MNNPYRPPAQNRATPLLALTAACCAGVLWGSGALVVNLLIAEHGFTAQNISFWRFFIGAVVLLLIFGRALRWQRLRPLIWTVLLAGSAMAGYVLLWFLGIARMGAAVPTLIALCLPPVIVTVLAVLRGQERGDDALYLMLGGALLGTFMIVLEHGADSGEVATRDTLLGVLFSVGSALLYACFTLVSGKLSNALGAGPATACLTITAATVTGVFAINQPYLWPQDLPPQAWFLYLGVITAALALLAFSWGAARLSATALTVATLLEPLTAVALAALLLNQQLSPLQWLGGALLLVSIWLLGKRTAAKG
ncbi:MAG: DMT family transporter [Pseudomonadales bacterium]